MVFEVTAGRVLLFGGMGVSGLEGDTWIWDGTDWTSQPTPTAPGARRGHAMAHRVPTGRTVLFGGLGIDPSGAFAVRADTWEWDGSAWSQRTPGRSPPGLRSLAMTYDDARDRAVLYAFAQNWEWDGSEWLQRTTAVQPASREFAAMVFDLARRRIVMFGGKSVPGTVFYDDIWDYRTTAPASYAAFGAGCAGPAGTPRLRVVPRALPWIGDALELTVTAVPAGSSAFVLTGLSRTNWRGLALPFALGPVGMPGCQLLVAPAVVSSAPVTAGTALWSQPLPAQPSLIGLRFYNQGLVLAPGINAAGAVVSDAGAGTVGAR